MSQKNIILLGIKHSGKSTQGKLLAKKLNCAFCDSDEVIVKMTGKTPREIYDESGADAFMQIELDACKKIIEDRRKKVVVATGGGICDNVAAVELLGAFGKFVFLETPEKIASDRIVRKISIGADGKMENLPAYIKKENPQDIMDVRKIFHEYYERRTKAYRKIAAVTIRLDNAPIWKNAELIWEAVCEARI